jgi:hypothetical protein
MYLDDEINKSGFGDDESAGRFSRLPVMQKAKELLDLAKAFCNAIEADDADLTEDPGKMMERHAMQIMLEDAFLITNKIAGAEGMDTFSAKMENALLVKRAAINIHGLTYSIAKDDFGTEPYLELIRMQVDDFKTEFICWVQGFDRSNDIPDSWGIQFQ